MKLKIQKAGKTQEFNLINSWSEVNLDKWAKLVSMKTKTNSQEAVETISVLADMPKRLIKELAIKDVSKILEKIAVMQSQAESKLTKIITIDDIEYGFHPNLDELTLGEYADIETLINNNIEDNLAELMAILFRPIIEKKNKIYTIGSYDAEITIRAEAMKKMSGQQVQNAMVFFWIFGKELLRILPLYLMELSLKKMQELKDLEKGGVGSV
jgi:hypothetical protein|tara:strand:+ start:4678 stop:5313 length:636 start_codon:yes stop_codon:yes gene_type:complete